MVNNYKDLLNLAIVCMVWFVIYAITTAYTHITKINVTTSSVNTNAKLGSVLQCCTARISGFVGFVWWLKRRQSHQVAPEF
jgi:hypothetical protein